MRSPASFSVFALMLLVAFPGTAQESDFLCYWRTADGSTRDLGSLCQPQRPVKVLSADEAFLANYQTLARQYPAPIQQQLQNQDKTDLLTDARWICQVLKFGGTSAATRRQQAIAATDPNPTNQARRQIVGAIAPTYYCPTQASDRR